VRLILNKSLAQIQQNVACILDGRMFQILSFIKIVNNDDINYFSPDRDSIIYRYLTSRRHICQYFIVEAFGFTRLYILSERK
jgi:hypothetical protein